MERRRRTELRASYDRVVEQYVTRIFDELQHKPLDRRGQERMREERPARRHGGARTRKVRKHECSQPACP